jgi:hypothetical protein
MKQDGLPRMQTPPAKTTLIVWWLIWLGILGALVSVRIVVGDRAEELGAGGKSGLLAYVGVGPLVLSTLLRWFVMPRMTERAQALVVFVVGVSLAEGCGLLGIFLGGEHRDTLFLLGIIGVAQWIPLFATRYFHTGQGDAHGLRVR